MFTIISLDFLLWEDDPLFKGGVSLQEEGNFFELKTEDFGVLSRFKGLEFTIDPNEGTL